MSSEVAQAARAAAPFVAPAVAEVVASKPEAHVRSVSAGGFTGAWSALTHAVLGPPGRARFFVAQSFLTLIVYGVLALVQQAEVMLELIDAVESARLTVAALSGASIFYLLVRSGVSRRWTRDPALTMPQLVFSIVMFATIYAITGPARGAVMTLLVIVSVFTMFSLSPGQSRAIALFTFCLLGAVMSYKSRSDPSRYPVAVEAIHFCFAALVEVSVSVLAGRVGAMRDRMRSQKLELKQALAKIGQLANRDELTGLFNRRHMLELLHGEQVRQRRAEAKSTVVMLDIDFFKRINDSHGHAAGDRVLRVFAEVAGSVLRASDVLARWGGEEFLLMLPATAPAQALHVVERLREALSNRSFDDIAEGLTVTFSAGLAACEGDDPTQACIERADQAMYRAKTLGRDRSVLA